MSLTKKRNSFKNADFLNGICSPPPQEADEPLRGFLFGWYFNSNNIIND